MINWVHKYLLRCKWELYKTGIETNTSNLALAFNTIGLFNVKHMPKITLSVCTHYYITAPAVSLQQMVNELQTALNNLKANGLITPVEGDGNSTTIRLDQWCLSHTLTQYADLTIYDAYQTMTAILLEIKDIAPLSKYSYIDRRCIRSLMSYLMLVEIIGTIAYGNK